MRTSDVKPRSYFRVMRGPLIVFVLAVALNILASYEMREWVLPRRTDEFLKLRMESFFEKAPALFNGTKYAFFWGASEIESGLDTDVLDEVFRDRKMDLHALNIGMRSVHPTSYRVFAHRVADVLEEKNQKIEVSFVKFPANKLTRAYHASYPDSGQYDQVGKFMDVTDGDFARSRPLVYLGGLFSHFLLADQSLSVPVDWIEMKWKGLYRISEEQLAKNYYFAPWMYRVFLEPELWRLDIRGSLRWNLPGSAEAFKQMVELKNTPRVRFTSYAYFEKCCGMNTLVFDQGLVDDFIAMLKDLKKVSKKVYLYEIPETTEFNLWRRNDYRTRLNGVLAKIQDEVDVEIIDTTGIRLKDDLYLDFLHLNVEGQKVFYSILMDRLISER